MRSSESKQLAPLKQNLLGVALLLVLFAALPLAKPGNYVVSQVTLCFIWACVVVHWNLVFGVAGIMSLGHAAVFGIGAYTTAMVATHTGVSFPFAFFLSAPAGMLFSLFLGLITIRMRGEYVAIVTMAVAILLYTVVVNDVSCFKTVELICYNFSGGTRGLAGYGDFRWVKYLGFASRALGDYYVALATLIAGLISAVLVIYGPFGLAFRAIRDSEIYARSRGVDYRKYQVVVFGIAGIFTGLAGGVYAAFVKTVGPSILDTDLLVFLLSMMIVGGRGSTWGPILGTAALMIADNVFQSYGQWRTGGLALITIAFIVIYPRGLAGAGGSVLRQISALLQMLRRRANHPVPVSEVL
jgi:branched-chain amino acid transport system permease protein